MSGRRLSSASVQNSRSVCKPFISIQARSLSVPLYFLLDRFSQCSITCLTRLCRAYHAGCSYKLSGRSSSRMLKYQVRASSRPSVYGSPSSSTHDTTLTSRSSSLVSLNSVDSANSDGDWVGSLLLVFLVHCTLL